MQNMFLQPNGSLPEKFVKYYLDPSLSPEIIQRLLPISRSSFYRLVEQSGIPTVKVGVIAHMDVSAKSQLHWDSFRKNKLSTGLSLHLQLAIEMSRFLGMRFDVRFLSLFDIYKGLETNSLDAAFASITHTPGRMPHLLFSEQYLFKAKPAGALIGKKGLRYSPGSPIKHVVGVVNKSMQQHYAQTALKERFRFISYTLLSDCVRALREDRVELILCHPSYLGETDQDLTIYEGPIPYNGKTVIGLSSAREDLQIQFDQALEIFYEKRLLQNLEDHFENLRS